MLKEGGKLGYTGDGLCQGRPEHSDERQREDPDQLINSSQSKGRPGECILRTKRWPWETKDENHMKDRMIDGLATTLNPGEERTTIPQRNGEGWSREGRLKNKDMSDYGKIEAPRKLTFSVDNCKQELVKEEMARLGRGRGHGGRGPQSQTCKKDPTTSEPTGLRRGRKFIKVAVHEAARAYREGMDADIRQLIQEMEDSIMGEDS